MAKNITSVAWEASNIPSGLSFDTATGTFSGTPSVEGEFTVPVSVRTNYGKDTKDVMIRAYKEGYPKFFIQVDIGDNNFYYSHFIYKKGTGYTYEAPSPVNDYGVFSQQWKADELTNEVLKVHDGNYYTIAYGDRHLGVESKFIARYVATEEQFNNFQEQSLIVDDAVWKIYNFCIGSVDNVPSSLGGGGIIQGGTSYSIQTIPVNIGFSPEDANFIYDTSEKRAYGRKIRASELTIYNIRTDESYQDLLREFYNQKYTSANNQEANYFAVSFTLCFTSQKFGFNTSSWVTPLFVHQCIAR